MELSLISTSSDDYDLTIFTSVADLAVRSNRNGDIFRYIELTKYFSQTYVIDIMESIVYETYLLHAAIGVHRMRRWH